MLDITFIYGIIATMNTKDTIIDPLAMTVRLTPELYKKLEQAKWALKSPKSEIIRKALTEYLKEK